MVRLGYEMRVERQQSELEQLGQPRSLFNWSGPGGAEVEARRQLLQEQRQQLTQVTEV